MSTETDPLKVEMADDVLAFLFLYRIGLEHYVTARVALQNGLDESGCLLAHQSIETLIKAIARLEPEEEQPWGHQLVELLKKSKETVPQFREMLADKRTTDFLTQPSNVYKWKRYGAAKCSINTGEVIQLLDELAFKLKKLYLETMKAPPTKLYVPQKVQDDFFRDNKFFQPGDVSHNLMVSFGIPGSPPDLPNQRFSLPTPSTITPSNTSIGRSTRTIHSRPTTRKNRPRKPRLKRATAKIRDPILLKSGLWTR